MFLRKRRVPPLKHYPTYSHLMQETQHLKVQSVSQGEYLDRVDSQSHGICGGLSTIHIIAQLAAKEGEIINPFESEELLDRGYKLQYTVTHGINQTSMQKLLNEVSDVHLPVKNIKKNAKTVYGDKYQYEKTENVLKRKIEKISLDKNSRATYIGALVRRNPKSGEPLAQTGRHAFSMTAQYHNDELHCTGMDSNFFFAHAKGETGCNELAEKISATLQSYNATDIKHISITLNNKR